MVVWSRHWVASLITIFHSDASPCIVTGIMGARGDRTVSWGLNIAFTLFLSTRVDSDRAFGTLW
jgi:hypothetical protein